MSNTPSPLSDTPPPPRVGDLEAQLGDEDPALRAEAARRLGRLGEDAAPALGALVEALDDPVFLVRALAASAIGRQGEPAAELALGPLVRLLDDPIAPVRFWAIDALGRLPVAARPARSAVEQRLDDEDQAVRAAAVRTVARLRAAQA